MRHDALGDNRAFGSLNGKRQSFVGGALRKTLSASYLAGGHGVAAAERDAVLCKKIGLHSSVSRVNCHMLGKPAQKGKLSHQRVLVAALLAERVAQLQNKCSTAAQL